MRRPALFLDRDGVINVDRGYVHRAEDTQFIDGIFDLCRAARQRSYMIIVVTNQAGIGRGYYTEADFWAYTDWLCHVFRGQGGEIDRVYFCPTHPEHGVGAYKVDSPCRKPRPGMILQAAKDLDVDLGGSILVGDKESDIEAGLAAQVGCNLLLQPDTSAPLSATCGTAVVRSLDGVLPYLEQL